MNKSQLTLPDEQLLGTELAGHVLECYGYTAPPQMQAHAAAARAQALKDAARAVNEAIAAIDSAARAQALEEAARQAELHDAANTGHTGQRIAAAIRALKKETQ